jgi:hypothetical protein
LFTTNYDLKNHDKCFLRYLDRSISAIVATRGRRNYSIEMNGEYLEIELIFVVGDKVILTLSLWTNAQLVNGDFGVVEQIVYNPKSLP